MTEGGAEDMDEKGNPDAAENPAQGKGKKNKRGKGQK